MPTIIAKAPLRVLVLLTVIVVGFLLLLASAVQVQAGGPEQLPVEYLVAPGDSLWEVAAAYTDPDDDIRAAIYEIRELNGLSGSIIHPGQVLLVPTG